MLDEVASMSELMERTQRASQSWHQGAEVTSVETLTGGSSSLTFTTRFDHVPSGDEVVVVKVAPPGLPPVRHRGVLHQGTVMRALADRPWVLVPDALFEDGGEAFSDMDWFDALTRFNEAVIASLPIRRAQESGDPALAERMVSLAPKLGRMLDVASARLSSGAPRQPDERPRCLS